MSDKITAYGVVAKKRIFKKVFVEFTSDEIVVRNKNLTRELFRAKLNELIVGSNYISPESENRFLKNTVLKSPTGYISLRFMNPYYAIFLLLTLAGVYFGGLSLMGVNVLRAGIVIPFTLIVVPVMVGFVSRLEKNRTAFNQFADELEKTLKTARVRFAAEGNEIAAIASPDAKKDIHKQYRVYVWGIWIPASLLFFFATIMGIVLPMILFERFIDDRTTNMAISLVLTLAFTLPLTWMYLKATRQAAKKWRDANLKAVEDELISEKETTSLRVGAWDLIETGWKPAAILAFVPLVLMMVGIFAFAPKVNVQQAEQISNDFVYALKEEDYAGARQFLCEDVTEDVATFYNELKGAGEDSFGSLEGFTHAITNPMGPQSVQFIYKHSNYPRLSFDTVVSQHRSKGLPCVEFAVLPLGFFSVEIGDTTSDYLREPGIDEPR